VSEPVLFVVLGGGVENIGTFSLSFKTDTRCDVLQQKVSLVVDVMCVHSVIVPLTVISQL
jgi:hypothetical protein